MRPIIPPRLTIGGITAASLVVLLSGCGTTRPLPKYEPPLARTEFQTVRTTAYTHTEADHVEYSNHNALGGTLRAAGPAIPPAATPATDFAALQPRAADDEGTGGFRRASYPVGAVPAYAGDDAAEGPVAGAPSARVVPPPLSSSSVPAGAVFGSAAADWSRWPAGTIFRLLPTGQLFKVDDYGWALSGRNTIDLYMPTRATMNAWGVRGVPIQVVQWGERNESLRILAGRQKYRHIRRMVLELEGKNRAAAAMH